MAEGGLVGGAGGVGDADDVEARVVGGAGGVEGILADGAGAGVGAAKAVERLEEDVRAALVERALRLDVELKMIVQPQPGEHGLALVAPCV